MTYAAEIRMVHASSVDHVPIRVYGVNLSLQFKVTLVLSIDKLKYDNEVSCVCTFN